MTSAAKSVYYFGYYLLGMGLLLIALPNLLLTTFQFPETSEVWIRVVGILVLNLGLFNVFMAPSNNVLFFTITVYTRIAVFVWFIVFVVMDYTPPQLILFGLIDLTGAIWTLTALRKEKK